MDFVIECIPRPWPKKQVNRKTGMLYRRDPKKLFYQYEHTIRHEIGRQLNHNINPTENPVILTCHFFIPRPKSNKNSLPATRPDLDNYMYAIANILQNGIYIDDKQIVKMEGTKHYADYNIIKWPRFEEGIVNEWWTEMSSYDSPVDNYLKQCRQPFTGVFIRVEEVRL